ncbi:hypothetical protein HPB50_003399 [Hyalomma asiaticum]|uniref:Uncharacterized protein n=1 Tax=Hyalomma asiaticum TaxID=266040 RepID=A0ACB7RVA5_HYAAI|nr:hypothetical protein HPB50_003399 [Hyalomma asiaticum]
MAVDSIGRQTEQADGAGRNVHATARHFSIDRKRVREWDKKFESLLQENFGTAKLRRKLSNGAPVFSEEVDDALFEFLERERSAGRAVSNRLLSEEAVKIAHSLQLGNFAASSQYIKRWKQRFGVTMRQSTNESQKTPDDFSEAAKASRSAVNSLRAHHDYTPYNICNMDQTMVRMDSPASRTNNVAGESTVHIANTGCARRGFTVALAACASGHKLPAFIVLKEPSGRISTKAFMSLRIPGEVWGPNNDDVRRLLVLDQAPIHKTQAAKDAIAERDTDVVYVPAGCTSLLQPADVFWKRPFKANLRRSWEMFMRKAERTPKGNLRKPSRQDALNFSTVYPFSTFWSGWADPSTHDVLMLLGKGERAAWYALLEQGIGDMSDGLIFDMKKQPLLFRMTIGTKLGGEERLAA